MVDKETDKVTVYILAAVLGTFILIGQALLSGIIFAVLLIVFDFIAETSYFSIRIAYAMGITFWLANGIYRFIFIRNKK